MHIAEVAVVVLALGLGSPSSVQLARDAAVAKAEAMLKHLQEGRTAEVAKELDARLTQALTEEKLKTVWPSVTAQFGAFKRIDERREGPFEGRQAVELILAFDKETIVMRTVFDREGKVGGLVFRPLGLAVLPSQK